MPQNPTGRQRILRLDGSIVDEFGNVVEGPRTAEGPLTRPSAPAERPTEGMTLKDLAVGGLKGLAFGTSLIPGAGPLAQSARIALPSLLEGGAAAVEGEDPVTRMAAEASLGGLGEVGGKVLPWVFNRAALASGGLFRGENRLANRATKAFTDINSRRRAWNPLLVGQVEKAEQLKQGAGKAIEAAENAAPGKVPLSSLGAANADFKKAAINTSEPITLRYLIGKFDEKFIEQQAMARNRIHPSIWAKLDDWTKQSIIDSTELTARDLGELKRGLGASSNPVAKARREGDFVPAQERQKATMEANLSNAAQNARKALDTTGDIARADKDFANAATVTDAHKAMRSTGVLADPSVTGSRMAILGIISRAMGLPMALGLAGPAVLSPQVLSATGHVGGIASRKFPAAFRGADAITSQSEENRARRRKPGEKK